MTLAGWGFCHPTNSTSRGENRCRPTKASVSEKYYKKYNFIPLRITHYNTTVFDAMKICFVVIEYFPVTTKVV